MIEFIDETMEKDGTPINRKNLMAIQGFESIETTFNDDFSIVETNSSGHTLITSFPSENEIVEQFIGEKTITKTTTFLNDGRIIEELS